MVVLLTGASGFIGSHLLTLLLAQGHSVVAAGRQPPQRSTDEIAATDDGGAPALRFVEADLTCDLDPATWLPRLVGVDAVINAAGIFVETGSNRFDAIHSRAPQALFAAATTLGIRRIIQISALGSEAADAPHFLRSKYRADAFLLSQRPDALVVRPSLVFDAEGSSARLFMRLAALPLLPVPGGGEQLVQPLHRDDLCRALVRALDSEAAGIIAAVGPEPLPLRAYLRQLRELLGLGRTLVVPIPAVVPQLGSKLPGGRGLVSRDALTMLAAGSHADPRRFNSLLGRPARPVSQFLDAVTARLASLEARLSWLLPLLRCTIALVWLTAGVVSLGIYPVAQSLELLAATGATGNWALLLLYGAAAFDLALGIATLTLYRQRWLWQLQIALILFYTVTISVTLPAFWAHPYGPLIKNLPMLAGILLLLELEGRRWNT